jgi:hypothetical protein
MKKLIRKIFLLRDSILTSFGCAAGKNQLVNKSLSMKIESIPEGICLIFDNIPPETDRLYIYIIDHYSEVYPEMYNSRRYFAETDITGNSLMLVKKTGKVFFPFVHAGHKYSINASFSFDIDTDKVRRGGMNWVNAVYVAESGNYYENYLELIINESRTSVTLSSDPVFPAEMEYNLFNYSYGYTISYNKNSIGTLFLTKGGSGTHLDFIPELSNQLNEHIRQFGRLENLDFPIFITAYCNIIYDNISWKVDIAKSPVFVYSHQLN